MTTSHTNIQLFQHDCYIVYYCFLMFIHACLTISTLVIVATSIKSYWCNSQCGIYNNEKPHRGTTIWTWYRHSVLLLSIVYSCTCLTISTFGDCSHHHHHQFFPLWFDHGCDHPWCSTNNSIWYTRNAIPFVIISRWGEMSINDQLFHAMSINILIIVELIQIWYFIELMY